MFIAPATLDQCREAIAIAYGNGSSLMAPGTWAAGRQANLQDLRDLVDGGPECARFLWSVPDEDPWKLEMRRKAFVNIPITGNIVNQRAYQVYGHPPTREFLIGADTENEAQRELVEDVYEYCGGAGLWQNRVAFYTFRDQISWMKEWHQESTKRLRLSPLTVDRVMPIPDPDDPADTIFGVVEVIGPVTAPRAYLWTPTESGYITPTWEWADPAADHRNPFGIVPFTRMGDPYSGHELADAALQQIVALNLRSWELEGWRAQSFAIFVLEGEMLTEETPSAVDGVRRTKVSNTGYIQVNVGGRFYAVKPDFNVKDIRESEMSMAKEAYENARVSSYSADSTSTPEQPLAMALRERRPLADRMMAVNMFEAQEKEIFANLVRVAQVKKLLPENVAAELNIRFPKSILPTDEKGQQELEGREVQENRRLLDTFVRAWVIPGATDAEVDEYILKLKAQKSEADAALVNGITGAVSGDVNRFGIPPAPKAADQVAAMYDQPVQFVNGEGDGAGGMSVTAGAAPGGGTPGSGGSGGRPRPVQG